MPSSYTEHYHLSQWVQSDAVLMDDFNADNARIDAAVKAVDQRVDGLSQAVEGKAAQSALSSEVSSRIAAVSSLNAAVSRRGNCQITVTPYTGDGATTRTFSFPAVPKLIIITGPQAVAFLAGNRGVSIAQDSYGSSGPSSFGLNWSGTQLTISFSTAEKMMNANNGAYQMIAFRDMS